MGSVCWLKGRSQKRELCRTVSRQDVGQHEGLGSTRGWGRRSGWAEAYRGASTEESVLDVKRWRVQRKQVLGEEEEAVVLLNPSSSQRPVLFSIFSDKIQ